MSVGVGPSPSHWCIFLFEIWMKQKTLRIVTDRISDHVDRDLLVPTRVWCSFRTRLYNGIRELVKSIYTGFGRKHGNRPLSVIMVMTFDHIFMLRYWLVNLVLDIEVYCQVCYQLKYVDLPDLPFYFITPSLWYIHYKPSDPQGYLYRSWGGLPEDGAELV